MHEQAVSAPYADGSPARDLFQVYWQTTPDSLFSVEVLTDGTFVFGGLNPSHEQATGLKSEALARRRPEDVLDAVTAEKVLERYRACVAAREPIRYLEVLALPGGERLWHTSLTPLIDEGGRVVWLLGTARDLTEQIRTHQALIASEERVRTILSSITDCYYTLDKTGRLDDLNPQAEAWFGVPRDYIIGLNAEDAGTFSLQALRAFQRALKDGEESHLELPSRVRPGCWIEMHVYPSDTGATVLFRDITQRKREAQEVERARGLLRETLDALTAQVLILDGKGTIVGANAAFQAFATARGLAPAAIGENYLELTRDTRAGARLASIRKGLTAVLQKGARGFETEYAMQVAGEPRSFQLRISRFEHDGEVRVVVAHEDVTETVRAVALAKDAAERVLVGQDQERRRIAMELHDSTGQQLVAMHLTIAQLRRCLEDNPAASALVDDLTRSLQEAHREIRTLSYLIHPPGLEHEGVDTLIHRFAEGFARRSGIDVDVSLPEPMPALSEAQERVVFRMLQESLVNVHRHSGSTRVEVRLALAGDSLMVEIRDNGRGFPGPPTIQTGSGIQVMQERIKQLGGALTIADAAPGAALTARLPLKRAG
ncbi:PAS domain-containing protein [Phenylobacterium sp. J367]|uniref:PAS domain-containing sensor histidine kinase n=1 Tax=Phenylobacterium sp. J367 TaxID=2898435 RepID=UPI0021519811|nr:PAS domain-containing protein [Phenylobacterium sp. J367]MCR5878927.1 PAS domain-containing protein [Phenylobacterium sp. J367]